MLLNILLKCYVLSCTFFCDLVFKQSTPYEQYGSNYEKMDNAKSEFSIHGIPLYFLRI